MSDQSDHEHEHEHELVSDTADDDSVEQDFDESETDQSGNFFDMEAEESDGDGYDEDEDGGEDESENGNSGQEYSFPQFSRLPVELRAMIWESIDPYLRSPRRVLEFDVMRTGSAYTSPDDHLDAQIPYASFRISHFADASGSSESESESDSSSFIDYAPLITPRSPLDPCSLCDSVHLASQTAAARTLLAVNRESRYLALKHYPNVIKIRNGSGHVRFKGTNDVILLNLYQAIDASILSPWCHEVKNLAFHLNEEKIARRDTRLAITGDFARNCKDVEAIFCCLDAEDIGHSGLGRSISPTAPLFYVQAEEVTEYRLDKAIYQKLYCWPEDDTTSTMSILKDAIHVRYAGFHSLPVRLMIQYTLERGMRAHRKATLRYLQNHGQSEGLVESSSEGGFYESELDEYELDGFVVGTSEGHGGSTDDEDGGASVDMAYELDDDGNLSDTNSALADFHGFSPLQDPSDDEGIGHLPDAVSATSELGAHEGSASDASSPDVRPRASKRSVRQKRRIISSDAEDDDSDDGGVSAVRPQPRVKRARLTVSDSEEEGGKDQTDGGGYTGSGADQPSRLRRRARVVLSDSEEDEEGEEQKEDEDRGSVRRSRRQPPIDSSEEEVGENDDEVEEDGDEDDEERESDNDDDDDLEEEDDDESDEEEAEASKPMSLLAKLRQFRSDIPVSPEGGSIGSGEEYDDEGEGDEDDEGQPGYDAEFPDSAEEDDEEDGW